MADVDHELGAIRFIVNAPLSSKVAMFNNVANQHKDSQLLNPFSADGDMSKRGFSKDDYGKPLAGSLTEMRGAKASIHVCKEMLQLCQIIEDEGWPYSPENPDLKVIRFGDLFNIYTLISDKVVGILLRARKYKLIDFEGEVLFQRRDDDVLIFMLKSLEEIKHFLEEKQDEVRRSVSPAPNRHLDGDLRRSLSPSPRPSLSRGSSPAPIASKPEQRSNDEDLKNKCNDKLNVINNKSREVSPDPAVSQILQNSTIAENCVDDSSAPKLDGSEKDTLLLEDGVKQISVSCDNVDLTPKTDSSAIGSEQAEENIISQIITENMNSNEGTETVPVSDQEAGNANSQEECHQ